MQVQKKKRGKMQTNKLKLLLIVVIILSAFTLITACTSAPTPATSTEGGQQNTESEPYRFSMIAPFTGPNAQYGLAYRKATDLIVENTNKAGGINGHLIEMEYYDDKNDAKEAVNIATNLVNDTKLLGALGSQTSTPSMAIAPLFQKAGIPLISPNASHDDFTPIGNFIFRTTYVNSQSAYATAEAAYKLFSDEVGDLKVGMIYMNTDWGVGFYEHFSKKIEELGGTVPIAETYVANQTQDFTPLLTKIANSDCNVLVIAPNYSEGAQIVRQAKMLDIDLPTLGTTMLYKQEFLEIAGEDANGMYVMTMFHIDNPSKAFQDLKSAWASKYGDSEPIDEYVVKAYDAFTIMLEGVKANGATRDGIREYAASLKDWPGTMATISMDEFGNPAGPLYIMKVDNGVFVPFEIE